MNLYLNDRATEFELDDRDLRFFVNDKQAQFELDNRVLKFYTNNRSIEFLLHGTQEQNNEVRNGFDYDFDFELN